MRPILSVDTNFSTIIKNQRHKLPLPTKVQPNTLFHYQDIGISPSYCLQNDDVIKFDRFDS